MKDYHDLYLKCDVVLLAAILKNLEIDGCPSHCLTAPTLSWDAIYNITDVELDLISDSYVLEAEYLKELHELHKDYPLALDKLEIKKETLSDH